MDSRPAGQDGLSPGAGESVESNSPATIAETEATGTETLDVMSKKRKAGAGARGVANLTPEQLTKKRANDREAQRAVRERTKKQIERLERRVHELETQKPYQDLRAVIREKEAVEAENAEIKRRLSSVVGILQPLISSNVNISPTQLYTPSTTAQTTSSITYHATTPASSVSPTAALGQHHLAAQPPPPPPPPSEDWQIGGHSTTAAAAAAEPEPEPLQPTTNDGIDENLRVQLEQQRQNLQHYLDFGQERVDLSLLLGPGHVVPKLQRGINGAQDTPEYRHLLVKRDVTQANHILPPSNVWGSPPIMYAPASASSQHDHDHDHESAISSPGLSCQDTSVHHPYGHSPSSGHGSNTPIMHAAHPAIHMRGSASISQHAVRMRHCSPTCPLDSLILDFIKERRQRIVEGYQVHHVVGPRYPSVHSLLNPAINIYSHPVSKFLTDVLAKFPELTRLPEKIAAFYMLFIVMRWHIAPTEENFERLPEWIHPLKSQLEVPHPPWIDQVPFPKMRDKLVKECHLELYQFNNFFFPFTTTMSVSWPYDAVQTLLQDPDSGEIMINPVFESHLQNLDNWKLGKAFAEAFPSLAGLYNRYDEEEEPRRANTK